MRKARKIISIALFLSLAALTLATGLAQTETHNFTVGANMGNRQDFTFKVKSAGTIQIRAKWNGKNKDLALILNGPGQNGYYQRYDGRSPAVITQQVTNQILSKGTSWRVSIVKFENNRFNNNGKVTGTLQINYPSSSPVAAPKPRQYNSVYFDRLQITNVQKTPDSAIISISYNLSTRHQSQVYLGAGLIDVNNETVGIGFKPVALRNGSGTAKVEIAAVGNRPASGGSFTLSIGVGNGQLVFSSGSNRSLSTKKITVYLYEGNNYIFDQLTQDFPMDWQFGPTYPSNQNQDNSWNDNPGQDNPWNDNQH